jgi:hypothetical protein
MLNLVVLLLDVVLLSVVADNSRTFFSFTIIAIFVLKIKLNAVVQRQIHPTAAPSKYISTLLEPTPVPQRNKCPICYKEFILPRRISCNHVFCHDCALLTLAKHDTCPVCLHVPKQLSDVETAAPLGSPFESWVFWLARLAKTSMLWSLGWILPCLLQLRLPASSEVVLALTRISIDFALQPVLSDILRSAAWLDLHTMQIDMLVWSVAWTFTLFATASGIYASWWWLSLLVVCIAYQIHPVGA